MPDQPAFLIDRSLGREHLAAALTDLGLTVHTLASVWGEAAAQDLDDETWLAYAGTNDWVVLMKDDKIRRRPAERELRGGKRVLDSELTGKHVDRRADALHGHAGTAEGGQHIGLGEADERHCRFAAPARTGRDERRLTLARAGPAVERGVG